MVGTIDDFRAKLIGGGARANQFRVQITNPPAGGIAFPTETGAFLAKGTLLPSMAIEEIEIPFRGRTIRIAGDRDFADPWTVTFINDTDFALRNQLEAWSNSINDLATEDSEVLTEEMYIQLKTMLGWEKTESGCGWQGNRDKENMNLALAMIANCNIKESHTYLALLFAFLSDSMKDAGIWNSVNFKSVRKKFQKYIEFSGWNWCHVYNHLLESLIKDDALTEVAWKEISQKMYDDVLSDQMGIDSKNVFSISPDSIQLKPELKKRIKTAFIKILKTISFSNSHLNIISYFSDARLDLNAYLNNQTKKLNRL